MKWKVMVLALMIKKKKSKRALFFYHYGLSGSLSTVRCGPQNRKFRRQVKKLNYTGGLRYKRLNK